MYMAPSSFGAAPANYRQIELASRIEGASPHQLVAILFEELLLALDAMTVAVRRRDLSQIGTRQSRVLAILDGLESSLDMEAGGEVAQNLAAVYREGRRLALKGARENDAAPVMQARLMLEEIASAWTAIG